MKYCTYQQVIDLIAEREWESTQDNCFIICKTIDQCWTCKHSRIIGMMMKDEVQHFQIEYNKKTKCLKLFGIVRVNYLMNLGSATTGKSLLFNQVVSGFTGCAIEPTPPEECNPPVGESNDIAICK